MAIFPAAFAALEQFADWALETADARQIRRRRANREELMDFYNAVAPHVEAILGLCDAYPLGKLPAELVPLYNLALAIAEVAPHAELYRGDPDVPYAFEESRFIANHGNDPTWAGKRPSASR
jgi:hypothetical protein